MAALLYSGPGQLATATSAATAASSFSSALFQRVTAGCHVCEWLM